MRPNHAYPYQEVDETTGKGFIKLKTSMTPDGKDIWGLNISSNTFFLMRVNPFSVVPFSKRNVIHFDKSFADDHKPPVGENSPNLN